MVVVKKYGPDSVILIHHVDTDDVFSFPFPSESVLPESLSKSTEVDGEEVEVSERALRTRLYLRRWGCGPETLR